MKHVLGFIKTKFARYLLYLIICIAFLAYIIPMINKQHQLNEIKSQIELIEAKIEKNKQEWLNCDTNMKLWNKDNIANTQMVEELKTQYNNMVGFTEAGQPELSGQTQK